MTAREGTDRLRVLVETGIAINSELSLDGVLERIVEAAARVTDAQYAALGVIDRAGTGTEPLVIVIDDAEELRDEELAPLVQAAARSSRPVILRVIRNA